MSGARDPQATTAGIGIRADTAPAPVGRYPHARRVGDLLLLSGIGPRTPGSDAIPGNTWAADGSLASYDIDAQCRSVFANVRAVLEASGARWEDLVDVGHHRAADADRDRTQVHRRGGRRPLTRPRPLHRACARSRLGFDASDRFQEKHRWPSPPRSTCRPGSTSTGTC